MNAGRDVERLIARWLGEEAPGRAPDRILAGAGTTIDHTKQRRSAVVWRQFVTFTLRSAAIAAAIVLAVAGSLYLIGGGTGGVGSQSASPTASHPTPSPSVAPTASPEAAVDIPVVPASPLPDPTGEALPSDLIGRIYAVDPPETLNGRQLVLTLRAADDAHCMAMYGERSTCFTVLWDPVKSGDPGARGSARIVDGNLVISMALVPFDQACVGSLATYAIEDAGATLRGIDPPACTFPGFREF